jgi:hypothetical protein
MHFITAQIVRFVDSRQPGWVECEFVDVEDRRHTLKDKVPIFTVEMLDAESNYNNRSAAAPSLQFRHSNCDWRALSRAACWSGG